MMNSVLFCTSHHQDTFSQSEMESKYFEQAKTNKITASTCRTDLKEDQDLIEAELKVAEKEPHRDLTVLP